ncbi:hypothetical protein GCM10010172_63140 [Paractinoplanes ferrugineus]|uniref:Uncharacterized protein n=1 Tax=Paractinoplanes ferrugineus TaxID=113564 RepID=A0A919J7M6_9ACTN|nr:hypothetical protein Afe05nite_66520 [Actinoplanes ferrugineus]
MQDRQLGKAGAIEENKKSRDSFDAVPRLSSETGRRDEDATVRLCSVQRSHKSLAIQSTYRMSAAIPIGWPIHTIQTKHILPDDTIQSLVAGPAEVLSCAGLAPMTHRGQQLKY